MPRSFDHPRNELGATDTMPIFMTHRVFINRFRDVIINCAAMPQLFSVYPAIRFGLFQETTDYMPTQCFREYLSSLASTTLQLYAAAVPPTRFDACLAIPQQFIMNSVGVRTLVSPSLTV